MNNVWNEGSAHAWTSVASVVGKDTVDALHTVPSDLRGYVVPEGRRKTLLPAATARMLTPAVGHHATHLTGAPKAQVLMQRPVATSHSLAQPSSDPDASHWPSRVGQTVRTCIQR